MEDLKSNEMPDAFDRQLGLIHDLPDVVKTKAANIRYVPPMGVGGSQVFIVQTVRQRERGDTIFLEVMSNAGPIRLVVPPKVANLIARQREALTKKVRSRVAKANAADLAARGVKPGFMR